MRRIGYALLIMVGLITAAPALAHEGHVHGPGPVVVVQVDGPWDQRVVDFVASQVAGSTAQVVVLLVDSPGVVSADLGALVGTLVDAAPPVAMWVGPQDAVAYGGVAQLLGYVDFAGAAPGARIGYVAPTVAGDPGSESFVATPGLAALEDTRLRVAESGPLPDFLDVVTPSIGQFIAALDGVEANGVIIETVDRTTLANGTEVTVPSVEVRFVKAGLFTRFLRVAASPETAFFLLVAGLALIAFEFYAAGVGVTAAVAALALFLAGYGMSVLPIRWWAVAATAAGIFLFTWDFQRSTFAWRSLVATVVLLVGGLSLTDAAPQFGPRWWVVAIVVGGVGLFYFFAMTAVVRARFSTPTIGREHLVGRRGVATSDFDPDGTVSLEGAAWRAHSHRAAGIRKGDDITVLGVDELVLEVGPVDGAGESPGR